MSSETSNNLEDIANVNEMKTVPHLAVKKDYESRMLCCPICAGESYSAVALFLYFPNISYVKVYLINPNSEHSL